MQTRKLFRLLGCLFTLCTSVSCRSTEVIYKTMPALGTAGSFAPLKRNEYHLLHNISGKASTWQLYVLFFPVGRAITSDELEQNAYYDAIHNTARADALTQTRVKNRQVFIPLLLINYRKKEVTITGRAIQLLPDTCLPHPVHY